ncbi:family 16 glycoside hydrolase [Dyadobacter sp. CY312]|uniref:family 16 glycoside hydrolase n=1 Tax=Dyadobacter sp. CY312 TaxID=2907303 RepID=UPI001F364704|nr:family 16 glycoside hydrolase [Dyadobacter sp. CY312]MCE7039355.1 DUF1080 domain-containing protein [Dyadobacter sp. CY312]
MQTFIRKFSLLLLASPLAVMGQNGKGNYTPLPLKDLSAFEKKASNWSVQSGFSINPVSTSKATLTPGEGILVGTPGSSITSKVKAGDLRLSVEFMVSPGAEGYVILPGNQKVLISDNGGGNETNSLTSGYIGQFPIQNAAKAPGLWQSLELAYDAAVPQLPNSARLNKLSLNGVTVLETVYLPLTNPVTTEPISFEVKKGTIAFRNIGYQLLASRKPVILENLTYKVFSDKWDSKTYEKLSHEGKATTLTQEVTNGMREFHLFYEGDIEATEAGDYIFTTIYQGNVFSLDVDGKNVINTGESSSQENHSGTVALTQGKHKFKLHYSRFPWRQPALGLRVEKAGIRPYDLHVLSSLPEPEPKPYISVTPDMRPEMVRSFILLDGEKNKRTHCISVGSPQGWNYTVDLSRGALLQAWRGQFANVTEMWYERGEPQLLFPAGLTVPVSGKSSLAVLENARAAWKDSSDINFLGYKLDGQGIPAFRYAIGGATISDKMVSGSNGITRSFQVEGTPKGNIYALLGSGKDIVLVEKGLYQIDNRYYVQLDKKAGAMIRPSGEGKELILPISGATSYTMFW